MTLIKKLKHKLRIPQAWQSRKLSLYSICSLFLATLLSLAVAEAGSPVKLAISVDNNSVKTGEQSTLEVQLLDPDNLLANSSKSWDLSVEVTSPNGEVTTHPVVMESGQNTTNFSFPVNEVGIWMVVVKDKELLDAAVMLKAIEPSSVRNGESGGTLSIETILGAKLGILPQVELRIVPQRKLLADGKDSATVYGLLSGDSAHANNDIKLRLISSDGVMQPAEVLIPKGEFSGTTQLVSEHPGEIVVEFLGAAPNVELVGEEQLSVIFGAPITKIEIKASPPEISLLEEAELVVRLMGGDGVPLETDEARDVLLTIEQGGGLLGAHEFIIAAGSAEGRTTFSPTEVGEVILAAASPNLVSVQVPLSVTWPIALLIASALGGLVGGLLAFAMEKDAKWWRSTIGLVTGFVLYWAVIFLGLDAFAGSIAINPLSAFVISVMGGWLGTKVFSPLLKRLGLST